MLDFYYTIFVRRHLGRVLYRTYLAGSTNDDRSRQDILHVPSFTLFVPQPVGHALQIPVRAKPSKENETKAEPLESPSSQCHVLSHGTAAPLAAVFVSTRSDQSFVREIALPMSLRVRWLGSLKDDLANDKLLFVG